MNNQIFLEQFERLTDAPNAVARLRELVLQLAVQGKLVAQDEREEPAARLLERIKAELKRLIREKKIREAKPLPPVSEDEAPFEIPQGWMWARFGEVTINRDGERIPIEKSIREYRQGEYDYYGASGVIDKFDDYIFDKPLLLIGEDGANLINRSTPIAFIAYGNYWVNNHAHVLDSLSLDCLKYLELYINATDLRPYITGTAQPKMNQAKMNLIPVAVPPLEEQKRIVAKVGELMRLCDELERAQGERRMTRQRLNRAALDQLLAARDAAEFQTRWQTVSDHFPTLTAAPNQTAKLRQTVLQLAVQGKLTRQDPQDEPAPILLRRICAERERLVKEKRIKRADPLPPINPDETPFALPSGWTWARFPELGEFGRGKSKHRPRNDPTLFSGGKYPLVQTGDVARANGVIKTYTGLYNERGLLQSRMWAAGTLCITIAANIADAAILGFNACFPDSVVGFVPSREIGNAEFFVYFMETAKHQLESFAPSTAQKNINLNILERLLIPLPPLEEQKRIVATVNRLMALCDDLEAGLRHAEEDGERLLRAAVRTLLTSPLEQPVEEVTELAI
jgi:type I restriction enzyme, S subunit